MDLIEMILSKCDMRIAAMYDHQLAETEEEKALGVVLRGKYEETVKAVLEVTLQLPNAALHFCGQQLHRMVKRMQLCSVLEPDLVL